MLSKGQNLVIKIFSMIALLALIFGTLAPIFLSTN